MRIFLPRRHLLLLSKILLKAILKKIMSSLFPYFRLTIRILIILILMFG